MPAMSNSEALRVPIRSLLAKDSGTGPDSATIADAAVSLCERLRRELVPLLGEGGVAALYARSLHLTKSEFPWLALARGAEPADAPFMQLRVCLGRQADAIAIEGASAFIATFCGLLISLIGDAMTSRLLREAWPDGFPEKTAGSQL